MPLAIFQPSPDHSIGLSTSGSNDSIGNHRSGDVGSSMHGDMLSDGDMSAIMSGSVEVDEATARLARNMHTASDSHPSNLHEDDDGMLLNTGAQSDSTQSDEQHAQTSRRRLRESRWSEASSDTGNQADVDDEGADTTVPSASLPPSAFAQHHHHASRRERSHGRRHHRSLHASISFPSSHGIQSHAHKHDDEDDGDESDAEGYPLSTASINLVHPTESVMSPQSSSSTSGSGTSDAHRQGLVGSGADSGGVSHTPWHHPHRSFSASPSIYNKGSKQSVADPINDKPQETESFEPKTEYMDGVDHGVHETSRPGSLPNTRGLMRPQPIQLWRGDGTHGRSRTENDSDYAPLCQLMNTMKEQHLHMPDGNGHTQAQLDESLDPAVLHPALLPRALSEGESMTTFTEHDNGNGIEQHHDGVTHPNGSSHRLLHRRPSLPSETSTEGATPDTSMLMLMQMDGGCSGGGGSSSVPSSDPSRTRTIRANHQHHPMAKHQYIQSQTYQDQDQLKDQQQA